MLNDFRKHMGSAMYNLYHKQCIGRYAYGLRNASEWRKDGQDSCINSML